MRNHERNETNNRRNNFYDCFSYSFENFKAKARHASIETNRFRCYSHIASISQEPIFGRASARPKNLSRI